MEFFFAPPWERKSHDLFISQGKSPACVAYQINWKLLKSLLKLQSIFHSPQKPNHIRYYYSINRKFQNYTLFTQRPIRVTCPIKQIAGIHWDIYIKRSLGKHHDKHAACFFQRFPSSPKIESSCHVAQNENRKLLKSAPPLFSPPQHWHLPWGSEWGEITTRSHFSTPIIIGIYIGSTGSH